MSNLADRREVRAGDPRGTPVGEEIVSVGDQRRSVELRLSNALPGETLVQRVAWASTGEASQPAATRYPGGAAAGVWGSRP